MGTTHAEREARDLLEKYATPMRQTTHGTLYKFENVALRRHATVLVGGQGSADHGQGNDERKWHAVLSDVRKAMAQCGLVVARREEKVVEHNQNSGVGRQPAPSTQPRPSPLAGLQVQSKERRLVVAEITKHVELAPHHVQTLLRGCGYEVPDDAKVTFTAQGYVRVQWSKTTETTEE